MIIYQFILRKTLVFIGDCCKITPMKNVDLNAIDLDKAKELLAFAYQSLEKKDSEIKNQQDKIHDLQYKLIQALKYRFAPKSEKQVDTTQQLSLLDTFDEPAVTTEQLAIREADASIYEPTKPRSVPKRKPLPQALPRVEVVQDIPVAEQVCTCGCALTYIGDERSEKLEYIPAKVQVIVHVRKKYACKSCEDTIKTAPVAPALLPKSIATPSLLSHIAVAKYDDHQPLYRQEEILQRHGIDIARNTLGDWMIRTGDAITPLITLMRDDILSHDVALADETPLQVLARPGKSAKAKSYMWLFIGGPPDKQAIIYHYGQSRDGDVPLRFLRGFSGYLHTDAYSGYLPLVATGKVNIVACLAHIRRKFFALTQTIKTEGLAHQAMAYITELYAIETQLREQNADIQTIYATRQTHAKPIVDTMGAWLKANITKVPPKSPIGAAMQYALNCWPNFSRYLDDGRLHIDNNQSERAIKPFVIGRKNWMFCGNTRGAIASANLFSLIETAKAHGHNPYNYLNHVFTQLPLVKTTEQLQALLPYHIDPEQLATSP